MRVNPYLPLLAVTGAIIGILVWYFWGILLLITITTLMLRASYLYFWQRFGCMRCGGSGTSSGLDPLLNVHFHDGEPCYMCAGKKIPPKDQYPWHDIAKKATHKLQSLGVQEELLLRKIEQFRVSMKFSANTSESIVFAHSNLLAKQYQQLAAIESELKAYTFVRKQAFINAHNIHLIQLMDKERAGIECWDHQHSDNLTDSLYFVKDATFLQKSDLIPLLQQQNQDYLQLISEPMRKDIETAVGELKLLIKTDIKS